MSRETLGIYLNDHLAGSVFAVETLERLLAGNHPALPKEALQGLLVEIEKDREVLRGLLERPRSRSSSSRRRRPGSPRSWDG